jgi:site-specific recombinase XerD
MTPLAPLLEAFFTERLQRQRQASAHTIAAYRDAFRLLLGFTQDRLAIAPSALRLTDLDAPLIGAFLDHLEKERGNTARTRNARLAAVHSFFHYLAVREPAHSGLIQRVLVIPQKRCDRRLVSFLTREETEALLAVPDRDTWLGRRDYALLLVAVQTGLRVSELTHLCLGDLVLDTGPHLRCLGKGRKERTTPLTRQTSRVLRQWIRELPTDTSSPLFPTRRGTRLSRDAVEDLLKKHSSRAAHACPSLATKRISPHVLRHTTAVRLLHAGVDRAVIALWLGHESVETTQIYVDADLAIKQRVLARSAPLGSKSGRYRPTDTLLAFLEAL